MAVTDLAAAFYARMEQLDAVDEPWDRLDEVEREFYRQGVKAILPRDSFVPRYGTSPETMRWIGVRKLENSRIRTM